MIGKTVFTGKLLDEHLMPVFDAKRAKYKEEGTVEEVCSRRGYYVRVKIGQNSGWARWIDAETIKANNPTS